MKERRVVLAVSDLSVSFGGRVVLSDVCFNLREGQIVGLVGGNGSGKTTLLNAISGFVKAEGSITLEGREIGDLAPWRRARAGLIRTVQKGLWSDRIDAREADAIRRWCRGLDPQEGVVARLGSTMRGLLPLTEERLRDVRRTQDRVGVRRDVEEAFLAAPKVALLDEPLAGEGHEALLALQDLLRGLRRARSCGIIVEHRVGQLRRMVDDLWELREGAVVQG